MRKSAATSVGSAPNPPLTPSGNGTSIVLLNFTKRLGSAIDITFEPSKHFAQAFKRARTALFLIMRLIVTPTPDISIPLFSTSVRLHFEYAIQTSRPYR